jgi:hypothetical protein
MPRSRVASLSWIVAIAFVLGTGLLYVDRFNLVATPPKLPDTANMVDQVIGSTDYRQAIWPVYLWTNLLFAAGFVALAVFGWMVGASAGIRAARPIFPALLAIGSVFGAISAIVAIGAVNAAVWLGYCDCGFKETEIVSQIWAQMIVGDVGTWLLIGAGVVVGIGTLVLPGEARELLSPRLRIWTFVTGIVLIGAPVLGVIGKFGDLPDVLTSIVSGILVPVWAVWLGRAAEKSATSA